MKTSKGKDKPPHILGIGVSGENGEAGEHSIEEIVQLQQQEIEALQQSLTHTRMSLQNTIQTLETSNEKLVKEVQELNFFLSAINNISPAAIYVYDLETQSNVYASKSIGEILGYTKEEVQSYGSDMMAMIMMEDELPRIAAHHEKLKTHQGDNPLFLEYRMKGKDGEVIWVTSYDKPFKQDDRGITTQIIGVAQNITAQKQADMERERLVKLFRNITNLSPAIIYILDLRGPSVEFISPSVRPLLGYTVGEVMKLGDEVFNETIHPDNIPEYVNHLTQMTKVVDDAFHKTEYRIKHKSNGYRWVNATEKVYERDENGTPTKIIGVAQDETAQKQTQLKLERANEELKRFAYISSHDLKEPLNTVISLIDVIKMEMENNAQILDLLDLLDLSTVRMKRLIDDLLSYSLLEQQQLSVVEVDLNEVVSEIRQDLSSAIEESEAEIHVPVLPTVSGDLTQLRQLIQNLISNAIKYRKDIAPKITITAKSQKRNWLFAIEDNGIGIAKKNAAKIFQVFQKLHASHEFEGTGIGLANCQRIVKNHGGEIWVESKLGKGSTFYFTLDRRLKPSKKGKIKPNE